MVEAKTWKTVERNTVAWRIMDIANDGGESWTIVLEVCLFSTAKQKLVCDTETVT